MRPRSIIHLNIADFAARVEACLTPSLKDYPLVIAPIGAPRAQVYDMNEQAFKEGIRKGMPLSRVKRLHRGIPILPPRFNRYEQVMKQIAKQSRAYSPAVESGTIDGHLFIDITGTGRLYGPPPDVAFRLKESIQKTMGLDPIWSLATNKLVAKVATRVVKPRGEYIVRPGEEAAFLGPLSVSLLPGLSRQEIQTIRQFNLIRVAQVRALTPAQLSIPFPERAPQIRRLLRGEDPDPVARSRPRILKADHEFITDTNDADTLKAGLAVMTADLCTRLRHRKKHPKNLTLTLSYSDGICHAGSGHGTPAGDTAMLKSAWTLFLAIWKRRVRIRHLSLSCTTGPAAPVQADLFLAENEDRNTDQLAKSMDRIRQQFGRTAIQTATAIAAPCSP